MGNHDAGRAMGRAAELIMKVRVSGGMSAVELLDEICGPYKNTDAEFEAEDPKRPGYINPDYERYTDPQGPIGKLIIEAFASANLGAWLSAEQDDNFWDKWYDGPYGEFRKRFGFW